MSSDERTLLAELCKQRDALAKAKLAPADREALRRAVDAFITEAQKVVAVHGELLKRLEQQRAARKELDAKDKALSAAAKAFPGKLSGATPKMQAALKAIAEARKKPGGESVDRIARSMKDLNMVWIDLSVFQELPDW
jgi:uncharacterized coiled-coil DUF342 family protein